MLAFSYYIFKVITCSAILYGYYWFFLRNKIFNSYNRVYLLAVIILSFTLPLLKFNIGQKADEPAATVVQMLQVVNSSDEFMDEIIIQSHYDHINKEKVALWVFIIVCIVFALLFLTSILKIYLLKKNNPKEDHEGISLVYTNDRRTPFSFFKNIFWNNEIDINSSNGKRILKHELAHVQEKHSHDKLFVNIVLIFFWCNPICWLIRRELNMIHEFLADKKAIEDGDTASFAEMILQSTYPGHQFQLTNNFFYSPIKRRLSMLTNNKTKVSYLSRILVLPLAAIVFAAFTLKAKTYINSLPEDKIITVVIDPGHGGSDNGAVAPDGTTEKDITLSLAKQIQELNKSGYIKILLTRETDIYQAPKQKAAVANKSGADLFISLHVNNAPAAGDERQTGMTVYVARDEFKNAAGSKLFASAVTYAFRNNYLLAVPANPSQRKTAIMVLEEATCPSVLIEAGFVSNKKDLAYLQSSEGKEQFAKNILNAITNFALVKQKDVSAITPADTVPVKQSPVKNNAPAEPGSPVILNDIEINFEAGNAEMNKKNTSSTNENYLLIIDGKEFSEKELFNKKLSAKKGLLYSKNDPAMLNRYGNKAKNGVLLIEKGIITAITDDEKKPAIEDYHLSINSDSSYPIIASEFITPDNYKSLKILNYLLGSEKTKPLLFIDGKPENFTPGQQIFPAVIQGMQILNGKDAVKKYGSKEENGAIEIISANETGITLSGIKNSSINISRLKEIKELKFDDAGYTITSATVYFSGEGFPDVVQSTISDGSLKNLQKFMDKIVAGSRLTFDNIYVSKKDGSNKTEVHGRSFVFYDSNLPLATGVEMANKVFTKVEKEPEFPGGKEGWQAYLKKNINSATPVDEGWKPGTYVIVVNFIVDKEGNVSTVSSDDYINSKTTQQCINLIKNGPKWIPAKQNGKTVNAYRKQPITFVVSED